MGTAMKTGTMIKPWKHTLWSVPLGQIFDGASPNPQSTLPITPMIAITQKPWHPVVLPGEDPELIARLGRPMPTGACLPVLVATAARDNGRSLPAKAN